MMMMNNKNNHGQTIVSQLQNNKKKSEQISNSFMQKVVSITQREKNKTNIAFLIPKISRKMMNVDAMLVGQSISTEKDVSEHRTNWIFLPHLPEKKTNRNHFMQKYVVNESIFIHQRRPIDKPLSTLKNIGILEEKNKKIAEMHQTNSNNFIKGPKRISDKRSRKKIVEEKEKPQTIQKKKKNSFYQKNQKPTLNLLDKKKSAKLIGYESPRDEYSNKNQQQKQKVHSTIDPSQKVKKANRQKSQIQKMINQYKANKDNEEKNFRSQKNIVVNSYQQIQKIKITGQQTTYKAKEILKPMKESFFEESPTLVKFKINWKFKDFPFQELPKIEASKLLSSYLFLKEINPIFTGYYKVYVGEGNNGIMISRSLKNRGFWQTTDNIKQANFVWTQLPLEEAMESCQKADNMQLKLSSKESKNEFMQSSQIATFLKHKKNSYFEACQNILRKQVYLKFVNEIMSRFKNGLNIRGYINLKDMIKKYYHNTESATLVLSSKQIRIVNHIQNSNQVGDKKNLFYHLSKYIEINLLPKNQIIPETVHISKEDLDSLKKSEGQQLSQRVSQLLGSLVEKTNYFILKPGESTNRGNGITVHLNQQSLVAILKSNFINNPLEKTCIVQQYIEPLLYNNRKFDIRMWALFSNNKIWLFRQGYVRTSSKEFNMKSNSRFVHLTNDAVQKHSDDYGKYQAGNKVSFSQMHRYLKKQHNYEGFYDFIYRDIVELSKKLFEVGSLVMGSSNNQFELFGLDFLIDKYYKVWLIECNTNPCLQTSCSLLNRLIPLLIDNLITISVDPYFPQPQKRVLKDQNASFDKFNFMLLHDANEDVSYLTKIAESNSEYLSQLKEINSHKLQKIV